MWFKLNIAGIVIFFTLSSLPAFAISPQTRKLAIRRAIGLGNSFFLHTKEQDRKPKLERIIRDSASETLDAVTNEDVNDLVEEIDQRISVILDCPSNSPLENHCNLYLRLRFFRDLMESGFRSPPSFSERELSLLAHSSYRDQYGGLCTLPKDSTPDLRNTLSPSLQVLNGLCKTDTKPLFREVPKPEVWEKLGLEIQQLTDSHFDPNWLQKLFQKENLDLILPEHSADKGVNEFLFGSVAQDNPHDAPSNTLMKFMETYFYSIFSEDGERHPEAALYYLAFAQKRYVKLYPKEVELLFIHLLHKKYAQEKSEREAIITYIKKYIPSSPCPEDIRNIVEQLFQNSKEIPSPLKEITYFVDVNREKFLSALTPYIERDEAPGGNWDQFLEYLSMHDRKEVTRRILLKKNGNEGRCDLTNPAFQFLFNQLTPREGVNQAVQEFWASTCRNYLNQNAGDENHSRFCQMVIDHAVKYVGFFGGPIDPSHFPAVFRPYSNNLRSSSGGNGENSHGSDFVALASLPYLKGDASLTPEQLHRVFEVNENTSLFRNAIRQVFGYVIPPNLRSFYTYLNWKFEWDDYFGQSVFPSGLQQLRGLIVQGVHEKNNHSIFNIPQVRGAAQVEEDIPNLNVAIQNSLREGILKDTPPLERRLFIENWNYQGDLSLIQQFRNDALALDADEDRLEETGISGFGPLRAEIHNLPTAETLGKLERFRRYEFGLTERQNEIFDRLLENIKKFLSYSKASGSQLVELVSREIQISDPKRKAKLIESFHYPLGRGKSSLSRVTMIREELKKEPLSTKSILDDITLENFGIAVSSEMVASLPKVTSLQQLESVLNLSREILNSIRLDEMLTHDEVKLISAELDSILTDPELQLAQKLDFVIHVLESTVERVATLMQKNFGSFDEKLGHIRNDPDDKTPRAVDAILRSHSVFILSKLVDQLSAQVLAKSNLQHKIGDHELRGGVEIFNPGVAEGTLRLNAKPNEVLPEDIPVFTEVPSESNPVAGMITLGTGARLSHLQLLARALQIPNIKLTTEAAQYLEPLNGKKVKIQTTSNGELKIEELEDAQTSPTSSDSAHTARSSPIAIPIPDHTVKKPLSFHELAVLMKSPGKPRGMVAGPKGMHLVMMSQSPVLKSHIPDGVVIPFGVFDEYAHQTGIKPWLELLGGTFLTNESNGIMVANKIRQLILATPIPGPLLGSIVAQLHQLKERTHHEGGYFFRSDTNFEDLEGFNGAGLNDTLPNVPLHEASIDQSIRRVWISALSERSLLWRAKAVRGDHFPMAEPCVVVMPTIHAQSSGVILSKGNPHSQGEWQPGRGSISANWGIGSVVQSGQPVEEISLMSSKPHVISFSSYTDMPAAGDEGGGLRRVPVPPGHRVLSDEKILELNRLSQEVEKELGSKPHGWDIEFALDASNQIKILQARPNM